MCTAATYQPRDFYMGRTLDYEFSYGEEVVVLWLVSLPFITLGRAAVR